MNHPRHVRSGLSARWHVGQGGGGVGVNFWGHVGQMKENNRTYGNYCNQCELRTHVGDRSRENDIIHGTIVIRRRVGRGGGLHQTDKSDTNKMLTTNMQTIRVISTGKMKV